MYDTKELKRERWRYLYHTIMIGVCDILHQLHILSDEETRSLIHYHWYQSFYCGQWLGYDILEYFFEFIEEEMG